MIGGSEIRMTNYALLTIFLVIAYIIIVDPNVSQWVILQIHLFRINMVKCRFVLTLGIRLRYDNFRLKRALNKIRKDYGIHSDD
jgi:hypothetical protein